MLKKVIVMLLVFASLRLLSSCGGEKKIVHCDSCGAEVEIEADSAMQEDWLIYCEECNKGVVIE